MHVRFRCVRAQRLVRSKDALPNIMAERDVLTLVTSPFITNIKYAFQDEVRQPTGPSALSLTAHTFVRRRRCTSSWT